MTAKIIPFKPRAPKRLTEEHVSDLAEWWAEVKRICCALDEANESVVRMLRKTKTNQPDPPGAA